MFKKYSVFIISILVLIIFSSCGIIRIDTSVMKDQLTDFSSETYVENSLEDCGCYGPSYIGNCTYDYAPVCGCDDITYGNACEAQRNGIYIYTRGECGKQSKHPRPYPADPPAVVNPPVVNLSPTNYPEVQPWRVRPSRGTNNKLPNRN